MGHVQLHLYFHEIESQILINDQLYSLPVTNFRPIENTT